MKSKWLPTFPLHAANWLADPRVQMLKPGFRSELLEALLKSWMLGKPVEVFDEIAEAYAELWAEYDAVRVQNLRNYERRSAWWDRYSEELSDPRWAQASFAIKSRDGFMCVACGGVQNLHVHHLRYKAGEKAWETPSEFLTTLCKACHEAAHGRSL